MCDITSLFQSWAGGVGSREANAIGVREVTPPGVSNGGRTMTLRASSILRGLPITLASLAGALVLTAGVATANEDGKYPDLRGQWRGVLRTVTVFKGQPSFDPSKSWGRFQEAPLTPEYQAIMEASIKDQEEGGFGNHRGGSCLGFGMPIIAYGFEPQEFIVTPDTTYILVNWVEHTRRIFTDGRDWPSISNRRSPAIPSGAGSTRIRMAATMCLKSKPAGLSRDHATTTPPGFRCTATTNRFSRSASIWTGPTRTLCTMRSP